MTEIERQIGDYTHTFAISREEAEQLLENGERFVAMIRQYLERKNG